MHAAALIESPPPKVIEGKRMQFARKGLAMDTPGMVLESPMLLTMAEAARLLAISPRQMHDLTKEGRFVPIRLGRSVRFSKQAIEAWIQSQHSATETT